jgi:hypothetical protein
MGEYAHQYMREEILGKHGFDIGEYDDEPKKARVVIKRVKCPLCECHPKERGLKDHMRDKHGIKETP